MLGAGGGTGTAVPMNVRSFGEPTAISPSVEDNQLLSNL